MVQGEEPGSPPTPEPERPVGDKPRRAGAGRARFATLRTPGVILLAVLSYVVLIDAALETFLSGSTTRWLVVGVVATYFAVTLVLWRHASWDLKAAMSGLLLLILVAASQWLLDGTTRGLVMLRQPALSVLAVVTALAVGASTFVLVRARFIPPVARWILGLLGAYSVASLLVGAAHGGNLWVRLPFWFQGGFIGAMVLLLTALLLQIVAGWPWARGTNPWWWTIRVLAFSMSLVMAAGGLRNPASRAQTGLELLPRPEKLEHLEALYAPDSAAALEALEKWKTQPPMRWAYDTAALASRLGPDVDRLFAVVRDDIRYEVYGGVLRGPLGTLMTAAGNSYDKTLLLGALLRHHGVEVRFVRGTLTAERATAQVAQMLAAARQPRLMAPSPQGGRPEVVAAVREQMALLDWLWAVSVSDIRAALEAKKLQLGKTPPVEREVLLREAADHLWLEYRKGQDWVALDPSVSGAQVGQTFADRQQEWTDVPDALFHRVSIGVVVEQRGPDGLQPVHVLRHDVRAADLEGAQVTLAHRFTSGAVGWTVAPVLRIGTNTVVGTAFSGSGMAAGAQNLGRRVFGRRGQSPAAGGSELAGEWLEIAFRAPSGATETVRRSIFDRIGPAARQEGRQNSVPLMPLPEVRGIPLPLGNIYALSSSSGEAHPGLALTEITQRFPELRAIAQAISALQTGRPDPSRQTTAQLAQVYATVAPALLGFMASSFHSFSRSYVERLAVGYPAGRILFYAPTPRLVISALEMVEGGPERKVVVRISLDLRRNGLRVVGERVDSTQLIWANVVRGVLDGALEHVVVAPLMKKTTSLTLSTAAILNKAAGAKIPIAAFTSPEQIQRLPVSAAAKARMLDGLADRAVIIAPARPVTVEGGQHFAWWQTDLASGETLGVGETGLHQGAYEFFLEVVVEPFLVVGLGLGVPAVLFIVFLDLLSCGRPYGTHAILWFCAPAEPPPCFHCGYPPPSSPPAPGGRG